MTTLDRAPRQLTLPGRTAPRGGEATAVWGGVTRLLSPVRRPVAGAVLGQVTQAVAGLVLSVAAARELGAAGLAGFSLVYGCIVLVTAVVSGLVGDSLTVLDRTEPGIRAGLHVWTAGVAGAAGLAGGLLAAATGLLRGWPAVVLGLAVTAFVLEDVLRRLLMATGRFWSLPAVDGTGLLVAVGTLAACAATAPLSLSSFALALLLGQAAAAVLAWQRLPADERPRGPWRAPDLAGVWGFGAWRAAAQTIRPLLMTGLRLLVVAAAGAAAYGPLEAARVYTAPTLVVVTGLGSFLLPHLVATRGRPATDQVRAADRVALGLAAAVALIGAVAVALQPVAGPLLTGGAYEVPGAAVAGWSAYAVTSAVLLPYAGLATVHRRQRRVLALRLLELGGLGVVCGLVVLVDGGLVWAPLVLAAGPLLVAVVVRRTVVRPLLGEVAADRPRGPA